jgi:hypothetical protein
MSGLCWGRALPRTTWIRDHGGFLAPFGERILLPVFIYHSDDFFASIYFSDFVLASDDIIA